MARLLKQSTAFTFRIGPFLDSTDGVTAETGLSIAQADIQISKNGGAFAQTSASPTTTHDADGWYQCPLTSTDTNTLGPLTVQIVMTGALPVWEHFMVVPANVYDSLVAGSDTLQADVTQISGSAVSTSSAQLGVNVVNAGGTAWGSGAITAAAIASNAITSAKIAASAIGASQIATDAITAAKIAANAIGASELATDAVAEIADAVWDELQSGHVSAGSFGEIATEIASILADTNELQTDDVPGLIAALNDLSAAEVNAQVDTALADIHLDHLLAVDYDPASPPGTATALLNELIESDAGVSRFTVNALENAPSGTGASAASIADAVWDEARSGHVSAGSFGEAFRGTTIGTAQAGSTTTTIVLASGAVSSDDQLNGATVRIVGGTGANQSGRIIDDSVASTDTCTVSPAWDTTPDNTSVYEIIHTAPSSTATLPNVNVTQISGDATAADNLEAAFDGTGYDLGGIDVSVLNTAATAVGSDGTGLTEAGGTGDHLTALATAASISGLNDPTAAAIADAVWDEAKAGHVTAGSFGEEVQAHALSTEISALNDVTAAEVRTEMDSNSTQLAAIVADTNELQTDDVPGLIAALDVVVDRVEADTQNIQSRLPAALSNGAIDANVARINDTAVTGNGASGTEWGPV